MNNIITNLLDKNYLHHFRVKILSCQLNLSIETDVRQAKMQKIVKKNYSFFLYSIIILFGLNHVYTLVYDIHIVLESK